MKSEIKREHLKNNFLKNIVVRFDYTGVAEVELDGIFAKIKPILKAGNYDSVKEGYTTELDFQFEDPEMLEIEGLPVKDIRKQRLYAFTNEAKGIEFKISARFAVVTVQTQKYLPFSEYSNTLINVMRMLKEEVSFLNCKRFGVRKINQCILTSIDNINNYFEEQYFSVFGLNKGVKTKLSVSKDCYIDGEYNINLARTIVSGEYQNKPACQVILDSDIYITDDEKINKLFVNDDELNTMNEKLFNLYKESLTEQFINALGNVEFKDEMVIGVESNG